MLTADVLTLQRSMEHRQDWIEYSAFDAEGTWHVYQELKRRLAEMPWHNQDTNMFDFYNQYLVSPRLYLLFHG